MSRRNGSSDNPAKESGFPGSPTLPPDPLSPKFRPADTSENPSTSFVGATRAISARQSRGHYSGVAHRAELATFRDRDMARSACDTTHHHSPPAILPTNATA